MIMAMLIVTSCGSTETTPERSCGPTIDGLTAETIIPTYRKVGGYGRTVAKFYDSIPVEDPLWVTSEVDGKSIISHEFISHVEDCIGRMEKLLEPRAEAGDTEAQYILGRLLLEAYNAILGGPAGFSDNRSERRKQAHHWLVKAMEAGSCEAESSLVWFYDWQLGFSRLQSKGHELTGQTEHSWLPKPKELLAWLENAAHNGNTVASTNMGIHYMLRGAAAHREDPEAARHYKKRANYYFALLNKQIETAPMYCPQLLRRRSQ